MRKNIKNILKKFFTQNMFWKIFSLFLSVALWFVVMNINNPTEIKNFWVNLTILNEESLEQNNIAILNKQDLENTSVQIKIKGTRQALFELNKKENKERISASLNLLQFKDAAIPKQSEKLLCNIDVSLPNLSDNYEIVNLSPVTAFVHLDNVTTISKKVNTKKIGNLKENYISSDISISSDYVQITGAKSKLDLIETVFVEANIENQSTSIAQKLTPIAYDSSGNKVSDVKFYPPEIDISIPIKFGLKVNVLEPTLEGVIQDGYIISGVTYSPKAFSVFVAEKDTAKIQQNIKPKVKISNLNTTTSFQIDAEEFFKNTNVIFENPVKIDITVNIEKQQEKEIYLKQDQIRFLNTDANRSVEILTLPTLKLKGSSSSLQTLKDSDIKAEVNLKDLAGGKHSLRLALTLPTGVYIDNDVFIELNLKEAAQDLKPEQTIQQPADEDDKEQTNETTE